MRFACAGWVVTRLSPERLAEICFVCGQLSEQEGDSPDEAFALCAVDDLLIEHAVLTDELEAVRGERDALQRDRDDCGPFFLRDMARLAGLPDDADMNAIGAALERVVQERDAATKVAEALDEDIGDLIAAIEKAAVPIHNGLVQTANLMCEKEAERRIHRDRSGGRDCGRCPGCLGRKALRALKRLEKAAEDVLV